MIPVHINKSGACFMVLLKAGLLKVGVFHSLTHSWIIVSSRTSLVCDTIMGWSETSLIPKMKNSVLTRAPLLVQLVSTSTSWTWLLVRLPVLSRLEGIRWGGGGGGGGQEH